MTDSGFGFASSTKVREVPLQADTEDPQAVVDALDLGAQIGNECFVALVGGSAECLDQPLVGRAPGGGTAEKHDRGGRQPFRRSLSGLRRACLAVAETRLSAAATSPGRCFRGAGYSVRGVIRPRPSGRWWRRRARRAPWPRPRWLRPADRLRRGIRLRGVDSDDFPVIEVRDDDCRTRSW
jgi:hypothetical protein